MDFWLIAFIQGIVEGFTEYLPISSTGRVRATPRLLKRLHVRGLIAKIPRFRRWRVTLLGHVVRSAAVRVSDEHFPEAFMKQAAWPEGNHLHKIRGSHGQRLYPPRSASEDAREGIRSFMERRELAFKGR